VLFPLCHHPHKTKAVLHRSMAHGGGTCCPSPPPVCVCVWVVPSKKSLTPDDQTPDDH
jgi:hypothetical protein